MKGFLDSASCNSISEIFSFQHELWGAHKLIKKSNFTDRSGNRIFNVNNNFLLHGIKFRGEKLKSLLLSIFAIIST